MKVFGLVGEVLGHSFSPDIHKKVFEDNKIDGVYNLFSVAQSNKKNIVASLKTLSIVGSNVTIPYKEEVLSQLDFVSDEAKSIGAINTIHIKDNKSYGYNTDYYGFGKMLNRKNIEIEGKEFYILGSGGASRSVIKYLIDNSASRVVSVSRNKDNARKKLGGFDIDFINYDELREVSSYAIVNTTPCGMSPNIDSMAVPESILDNFKVAIDIVYNPIETKFLRLAKSKGLKVVDGLFMLVGQAIKSEEIWNGIEVDKNTEEEIYNALKVKLNKKNELEKSDDLSYKADKNMGYEKEYALNDRSNENMGYEKEYELNDRSNKNILLIGMPGCGKTTIGKILSKNLGLEFIDMDDFIEGYSGRKIPEIFLDGEDVFRDIESKCCDILSKKRNVVISSGGGVVKRESNMKFFSNFKSVFINRPLEKIFEDIDTDNRPLLNDGKEKLETLYRERFDLYKKYCDIEIINDSSIDAILKKISKSI